MKQDNNSTKNSKWKQIDYTVRLKVEALIKYSHMKPKEIAEKLGYSRRTIERVIKKGLAKVWHTKYDEYSVELPDSMREKESVPEYSADVAEGKHIEANGAKGRKMKIGSNYALVEFLEKYIGEEKYSPYAALQEAKIQGKPFADAICLKTL